MKLTAASLRFQAGMGAMQPFIQWLERCRISTPVICLISRLGTTEATRMTLLDRVMTW